MEEEQNLETGEEAGVSAVSTDEEHMQGESSPDIQLAGMQVVGEIEPAANQSLAASGDEGAALESDGFEEESEDDSQESDGDGGAAAVRRGDTAHREGGRGCQHYRRGCKLVSPCCDTAFWCRFCHDAAKENGPLTDGQPHKLDRHAVREVECGACGLRQPVSQFCSQCGITFGNYFCRICNFFDDDLSKEPFHCDGCGICR